MDIQPTASGESVCFTEIWTRLPLEWPEPCKKMSRHGLGVSLSLFTTKAGGTQHTTKRTATLGNAMAAKNQISNQTLNANLNIV